MFVFVLHSNSGPCYVSIGQGHRQWGLTFCAARFMSGSASSGVSAILRCLVLNIDHRPDRLIHRLGSHERLFHLPVLLYHQIPHCRTLLIHRKIRKRLLRLNLRTRSLTADRIFRREATN